MKSSTLAIVPPHLPLMEGIVGFSALGVVLIGLTMLEKADVLTVNEGVIKGAMLIGFVIGLGLLLFKSTFLLGL